MSFLRFVPRVGVTPGTLTWDGELGDVVVSDRQRAVHVAAEAVAVFAVVPFMTYLATRRELPGWARAVSGVIAAGTLLVDGGLLWRYATGNTS